MIKTQVVSEFKSVTASLGRCLGRAVPSQTFLESHLNAPPPSCLCNRENDGSRKRYRRTNERTLVRNSLPSFTMITSVLMHISIPLLPLQHKWRLSPLTSNGLCNSSWLIPSLQPHESILALIRLMAAFTGMFFTVAVSFPGEMSSKFCPEFGGFPWT